MKKILLSTLDYAPNQGGVARYLKAVTDTWPQVEVQFFSDGFPGHVQALRKIKEAMRGKDVLWISHVYPMGTVALFVKLLSRKPYVVFLHGMDWDLARRSAFRRWGLKKILRFSEKVVVNSQALKKEVEEFVGVEPMVIYPCVSDELLKASEDRLQAHEGFELLTVGRLVKRKGHRQVMEVLPQIPQASYRIVGNGPELEALRRYAEEKGIRDRVIFETDVSDERLYQAYREADVFVMPTEQTSTDREGFGIVYLEAGLFELPVIARRLPGVSEAVSDRETGLLIEEGDRALPMALKSLLDDEDLRRTLGKRGRERVLAEFTREKQIGGLRPLIT